MPIAYSYIRFSSEKQKKGASIQRQEELATKFIKDNPELELDLDTALNMRDLGVSAFKGKNMTDGALGNFTALVYQGKIEQGSTCGADVCAERAGGAGGGAPCGVGPRGASRAGRGPRRGDVGPRRAPAVAATPAVAPAPAPAAAPKAEAPAKKKAAAKSSKKNKKSKKSKAK